LVLDPVAEPAHLKRPGGTGGGAEHAHVARSVPGGNTQDVFSFLPEEFLEVHGLTPSPKTSVLRR